MPRLPGTLLTILILGGCAETAPVPEPLRPVRSEIVAYGGATRIRGFSGTARAGQETNLSFRVPGRIVQRPWCCALERLSLLCRLRRGAMR